MFESNKNWIHRLNSLDQTIFSPSYRVRIPQENFFFQSYFSSLILDKVFLK